MPRNASQLTRLPSGLRVATTRLPHAATTCVGIWAAVGARHESPGQGGICHFLEHMLFKGTPRRGPREISEAVEGLGGYLNAFTTEEHTCYYARGPAARWESTFEVLANMYRDATFPVGEVRKERNVIREEIAMYLDQPHLHVLDVLNEILWAGHPLCRPITGTLESVARISRAHLMNYRDHHYLGANTLVTVAGPLDHAAVLRQVKRRLGRVGPGQPTPCQPWQQTRPSSSSAPPFTIRRRPTEQAQLALGFRVGSRHAENRFALKVLNTLLGENMSSRLFQTVREERGLVYSIYSHLHHFEDTGLLTIAAGLDVKQVRNALKLIRREMETLAAHPPATAELRRAKDYLLGQMDLHLESPENQMTWLGEQILGYDQLDRPAHFRERLAAVKPREIQRAAAACFRPENAALAVVSPEKLKLSPPDWVPRSVA